MIFCKQTAWYKPAVFLYETIDKNSKKEYVQLLFINTGGNMLAHTAELKKALFVPATHTITLSKVMESLESAHVVGRQKYVSLPHQRGLPTDVVMVSVEVDRNIVTKITYTGKTRSGEEVFGILNFLGETFTSGTCLFRK